MGFGEREFDLNLPLTCSSRLRPLSGANPRDGQAGRSLIASDAHLPVNGPS